MRPQKNVEKCNQACPRSQILMYVITNWAWFKDESAPSSKVVQHTSDRIMYKVYAAWCGCTCRLHDNVSSINQNVLGWVFIVLLRLVCLSILDLETLFRVTICFVLFEEDGPL